MTAVATAWAVENENGQQFKVSRESPSRVKITWLCGDVVELAPATLEEAVRNLRLVARHDDVWLRVKPDYSGSSFVVALKGGELYAARQPEDIANSNPRVSWAEIEALIAPSEPEPPAPVEEDGMGVAPEYGSPATAFRNWLRRRAGR